MAGFAGALRLDGAPLTPDDAALVDAMGAAIAHRGLARRRVVVDGPFAMVTADGAELAEAAGLGAFAFDGRARDARAAWKERGADVVHHLDGPFALAAWDGHELLLARDRVGLRPLFTARAGSLLLFGSEVKALLTHPACPRAVDWLAGLAYPAFPRRDLPPSSWFVGIDPVAPGTLVTASDAVRTRVYGTIAMPSAEELADDTRTDAQIIEGYRDVLTTVLADALAGEPERAGILLSGGIDSVSLASLAARHAPIPAFTVLGQSTFGNGDAGLAHRAATLLGLPLHPVLFRWREPIPADQWRRLLWLTETPLCAAQHYYKFHLHRHAADAYPALARVLTGEGSDEYIGADFRNHGADRDDATWADYLADLADKQRDQLQCLTTLGIEGWLGHPVFSRRFLAEASGRPLVEHPWRRRFAYVGQGMERDVLWRDDRLAAGNGLASDAPFMDHRLLAYVARVPERAWAGLYWKKRILREAMRGIVPEPVREAPKIPFYGGRDSRFTTTLLYEMLVADDHALVREALGEGDHPALAPGFVATLLEEAARDPEHGAAQVLLQLVNLGLLDRMAKDAAARPGPAAAIEPLPAVRDWDEDAIAARLADGEASLGPDVVLAFAPGVELVRRDSLEADPPSYIVVGDEIRFVLDDEDTRLWRAVLRRVDGARPLASILAELDAPLAAVRRSLEEAVDFGVVVVV